MKTVLRLITAVGLLGCTNSKPHIRCTTNSQCTLSGRPGVCIDSGCAVGDGTCPSGYRYDVVAGGSGECVTVARDMAPPPDLADPGSCSHDSDCTNAGKPPCGGICVDHKCAYPGSATDCGSSCESSVNTTRTCDGRGSCAMTASECGAFQCDTGQCKATCTNANIDCVAGATCVDSKCVTCPADMVYVPAASFIFGVDDALRGQKRVTVTLTKPYCIDKLEVSVEKYRACVTAGVCTVPRTSFVNDHPIWTDTAGANEQLPVNDVSWNQAKTYCAWTSLPGGARRIPTQVEWERAARGTDGRTYPWGETKPDCSYAAVGVLNAAHNGTAYCNPVPPFVAAVGSYPKGMSPTGMLDAAGNLNEWVIDCQAPVVDGKVPPLCAQDCTDPAPFGGCADVDTEYHGARGGAAEGGPDCCAVYGANVSRGAGYNTGFRCVK